jgi:hypothetical protein
LIPRLTSTGDDVEREATVLLFASWFSCALSAVSCLNPIVRALNQSANFTSRLQTAPPSVRVLTFTAVSTMIETIAPRVRHPDLYQAKPIQTKGGQMLHLLHLLHLSRILV